MINPINVSHLLLTVISIGDPGLFQIKLGIEVPKDIIIYRKEVYSQEARERRL